jgi:hypothetical protein
VLQEKVRSSNIQYHSCAVGRTIPTFHSSNMGKKRPAADDRGDAPKRFKDGTQRNAGPPREKSAHKKADVNGKKQKTILVCIAIGNNGSPY